MSKLKAYIILSNGKPSKIGDEYEVFKNTKGIVISKTLKEKCVPCTIEW